MAYPVDMRRWAVLAAVLIVIAIRCVPGQPGVINVGALVPPMPLKDTPTQYDDAPAPRPTFTTTRSPTPTPTPTPVSTEPGTGEPEPLPPPP
jgi:hypothetical protein